MNISFENINIFQDYDRKELAKTWGYKNYNALARGIVTPKNTNLIILFITHEQQKSLTQYQDKLEKGMLEIEGETNHSADNRIIHSEDEKLEIHLFYRGIHHTPFTYYGIIKLLNYQINDITPSKFKFKVLSENPDKNLETELLTHGQIEDNNEYDEEGKEKFRIHREYERSTRNRKKALEIHGYVCKACGFDFNNKYGKDYAKSYIEIHHTTSITKGKRIINPETDLIPLCSNCHSMAHRTRNKILSLDELKALIKY